MSNPPATWRNQAFNIIFRSTDGHQPTGINRRAAKPCPLFYYKQMCGLVEMDGLSTWVYSEWAMGLLERDSHPGASRRIVVTELEYDC